MSFTPTQHPILKIPELDEVKDLSSEAFADLMHKREQVIADEKIDPLRKGWEPPIWKICDALLSWDWLDQEWCERVRLALGFTRIVDILLINGGNRAGKSEYAAKRTMGLGKIKVER